MKPFSLTIEGKRWRVSEGDPGKGNRGVCHLNGRRIILMPKMTNAEKAATLIHEVTHAALWDLDEEAVLRTERAITTALHKAGLLTEDD